MFDQQTKYIKKRYPSFLLTNVDKNQSSSIDLASKIFDSRNLKAPNLKEFRARRVPIKGANDPRIVGQFGAAASEITGSLSIPRSGDVFAKRISLGLIKLKMHFAAALQ